VQKLLTSIDQKVAKYWEWNSSPQTACGRRQSHNVDRCKRSVNTNIALLKKPNDALDLFFYDIFTKLIQRLNV